MPGSLRGPARAVLMEGQITHLIEARRRVSMPKAGAIRRALMTVGTLAARWGDAVKLGEIRDPRVPERAKRRTSTADHFVTCPTRKGPWCP